MIVADVQWSERRNGATPTIATQHDQLLAALPFNDVHDFEAANRGFLGTPGRPDGTGNRRDLGVG